MKNKGVDAIASSSTADPVAAGGEFDVFLSFCGDDTRKGFTDFLYTNLIDAGILTFIDNEELKVGEKIGPELLKAINESKISIPIFSQKYASSKWCLLELQEMVECHENQGQMILPIFYDVTPSHVRNQSGSYEMAFIQHEKNFSPDTVQKWRDALRVVGELKGLELAKETNGHQGKLVKLVVEKVLLFLKKNYTDLPENLVRMDNDIEKLTRLLQVDSNDVRVVGIHGMGGLGKTTIAKVIYNTFCDQFEGQCFLHDVREKSIRTMVDLQKQLISSILHKEETSVSDVNEGKKRINDAIRGKKLLIVLDDVDDVSQVKMLMGDLSRFGQPSRIILTTRNKRVLDVIESNCKRENPWVVYSCYKPDYMGSHHALQLFSKYAFHENSPLQGYESLSKKVVVIAAGLPLVLVVLGSRFYLEYDTDLWEESLTKLQKIPDGDVMEKLKFSFDALDYTQQQIFLDIACLFIGYSKTRASYMWDDCGFYPRTGISVLVSRSLVTVGDDDILRMHDQLRDLGRHIVNEEGSQKNKPGEQSRLWCPEMAMQVLEAHQGTSNINALRLGPHVSVGESHFHHLPNLKYLCINFVRNIDGDFKLLLPSLRWLEYTDMIKFSPNNLNMENLVILHLSRPHKINDVTTYNWDAWSRLDDWDGWSHLKEANKLKVLDLSYCIDLQTLPNLSNLTKLVELDLSWCDKLTEIPGLEKLESLQVLNLRGCKSLETLPNISNFTKLKVFNAFYCHKLIRIEGLHKLLSLTNLDLRICSSLKEGVGDLSNLNKLQELAGAPGLDTTDFSNFIKLKSLEIYRNNRKEIQNLDGLKALEHLTIHMCPSIKRLPNLTSLKRLEKLWITECKQLTEIRDLGELKSLEAMYITSCSSLKLIEIESRARLDSLKFLRISDCMSLERLAVIPYFGMLQKLEVVNCDKLQEVIFDLPNFQRLEVLEGAPGLDTTDFSNFKKLKRLEIYRNNRTEIQNLDGLEALEHLTIHRCPSIERLPNLLFLTRLKTLKIRTCEQLTDIQDLGELKSLEAMYITSCSSLKLIEIESRARLDSLKVLRISDCMSLERLADLPNFGMLQVLEVMKCDKLQEVEGLGVIQSLERIKISDCVEFQKLPNLQGLKKLKKLNLWCLEKITAIHGLEELKSLESLNIMGCSSIEAIPNISNLQILEYLDVSGCVKLYEIPGLEELKSLEELNISRCSSIVAIPNISNLQKLKHLNVSGCVRLSEIHGLEELKSLPTLRIFRNQELPYLPYLPNVCINRY